jgi:hypothetical protein
MKCQYCGSNKFKKLSISNDCKSIPSGLTRSEHEIFEGIQCKKCLSVVNKNHLKPNYSDGFYSNIDYGRVLPSYDYTGNLISFILRHAKKEVLEIGAAGGNVARLLRGYGLTIEIVEPDVGYSRKLIEDGFRVYDDIDNVTKKYEVVYSIAVLEHVSDVLEFLKLCVNKLEVNGLLVLQYPNVKSLSARFNLKNWDMLFEPGHLNIPSEAGLTRLIQYNFKDLKLEQTFSSTILSRGRVPFLPFRKASIEHGYRKLCNLSLIRLFNSFLWGVLDYFRLGETIVVIYKKNG